MYRSAVSSTHLPVNGFPVGQHPLAARLLKDAFIARPPQPKYSGVWDVSQVTDYLESLGGSEPLSVAQLTKKLAMLLALVFAQRSSDLVRQLWTRAVGSLYHTPHWTDITNLVA